MDESRKVIITNSVYGSQTLVITEDTIFIIKASEPSNHREYQQHLMSVSINELQMSASYTIACEDLASATYRNDTEAVSFEVLHGSHTRKFNFSVTTRSLHAT